MIERWNDRAVLPAGKVVIHKGELPFTQMPGLGVKQQLLKLHGSQACKLAFLGAFNEGVSNS
ncbi:hypothetical protein AO284_27790 [Pseudomonas sp. NZIPFR-PS2]|nr:hypothetical protein AO284_27790 [Pseudomonas sp. NZIPFR-PS2]